MYILLALLAFGALVGLAMGIYFKFFSPDDFSMWNNEWFGKNMDKDQSYMDK
ncbi:MAG: hypothetical protein K6E85_17265 [Lachnospiraceae bacterium]|nr:hypothetical protein [Lachnospiraceae bacterium]